MPSIVQIFVVGGERKRRRLEGAAAAAILSAGGAAVTSAYKNEQDHQESGRGGGAAGEVCSPYHIAAVPRHPDPIYLSSASVYAPLARTNSSSATGDMLVRQQEEEQKKAQEDFDSLFDDQHVFGIPHMVDTRSDGSNETSAAASSYDWGQNPPDYIFSSINKDNSLSEGIGDESSTNNSTTDTQQSSNMHVSYKHVRKEDDAYFEERCNQLLQFKEAFGHCNVPQKYAENPSLGQWCNTMRSTHNKIMKGIHKSSRVLSKDRIERLEQIGFLWHVSGCGGVFERRCRQLLAFRDEFGHCNVPQKYKGDPSLGIWCKVMRTTHGKIQKGLMNLSRVLSQDRIVRLEEIGFQWEVCDYDAAFESRCDQLVAFKEEFGHCHVPVKYQRNRSLGQWCSGMRSTYSRIQRGLPTKSVLPAERIERLEEIGFQWQASFHDDSFEKRCSELLEFKKEFGHCNIPNNYPSNQSLGTWCKAMRTAYNKAQKGEKSNYKISEDRIERLENIGFRWQGAFEKRCYELKAFKEEFGHCNVPSDYADSPYLGAWCKSMRTTYNKMQRGLKTDRNLNEERIEQLEKIGFKWEERSADQNP